MGWTNTVVVWVGLLAAIYYFRPNYNSLVEDAITMDMKSSAAAVHDGKHTEIFKKPKVVKVNDKVYVAVGFALGNSILIEGDDGVIIVDTTESAPTMRQALAAFRNITMKPIKAVILTHFHTDHVMGTLSLFEDENRSDIDVYAHNMTLKLLNEDPNVESMFYARAMRQFGTLLRPDDVVGAGIGMSLKLDNFSRWDIVKPNIVYEEWATYTVSGIRFELFHTPGETPDQTGVWLPDLKTYLPADNIYQTFPNLYAIRGSPPRNAKDWYESLDIPRKLRPSHLVPSHTDPVSGEEDVYDVLTVYRDAIKFVHDQTVRLSDKGWHPDEIADYLRLPSSINDHLYLHQYYGTVEWSVRGVFDQYFGWFSGDPADLNPLSHKKMATRMALLLARDVKGSMEKKILAGIDSMITEAEEAIQKSQEQLNRVGTPSCDDDKWALEMTRNVMIISTKGSEIHSRAAALKVKSLYALHLCSTSANGRHYFLTSALEEQGRVSGRPDQRIKCNTIRTAPLLKLFKQLALKVDDKLCDGINATAIFKFTDDSQNPIYYAINLRNCVCDITKQPEDHIITSSNFIIATHSGTLRDIFCGTTSGLSAYMGGKLSLEKGGITDLKWFIDFFDKV